MRGEFDQCQEITFSDMQIFFFENYIAFIQIISELEEKTAYEIKKQLNEITKIFSKMTYFSDYDRNSIIK